jgi:hypothetical protein
VGRNLGLQWSIIDLDCSRLYQGARLAGCLGKKWYHRNSRPQLISFRVLPCRSPHRTQHFAA